MELVEFQNKKEEWMPILVKEGQKGVVSFISKNLTINPRIRLSKARQLYQEYMNEILKDAEFQKEFASIVLHTFTHYGEFGRRQDVIWFVDEGDGEDDTIIGPNANIITRVGDSGNSKYDVQKLTTFLNQNSEFFGEQGNKHFKYKIIKELLDLMKASDKRSSTALREAEYGEKIDEEAQALEEKITKVLSSFLFRGDSVEKVKDLPKNLKLEEIKENKFLNKKQYEEYNEIIAEYMQYHSRIPNLVTLQRAIVEFMKPRPSTYLIYTNADEVIGQLDLKEKARRERIYSYWEKVQKREEPLREAIETFSRMCKKLKDADIIEEVKKLNEEFRTKVAPELLKGSGDNKNSGLTYIIKFDTSKSEYQDAMAISRVADTQMAGLAILVEFDKKRKIKDAFQTRDDLSGLTEEQLHEALERTKIQEDNLSPAVPVYDKDDKQTGYSRDIRPVNVAEGEEVKDLSEAVVSFMQSVPDPLFYYVHMNANNSQIFNKLGIFTSEMKKIRNYVHYLAKGTHVPRIIDPTSSGGFKDLEEYLDKVERETIDPFEGKTFYLPLTDNLETQLGRITTYGDTDAETGDTSSDVQLKDLVDYNDNSEAIGRLMAIMSKYVNYGNKFSRSRGPILTDPKAAITRGAPVLRHGNVIPGRDTGENILPEDSEFVEAYNNLLSAIAVYYLIPNKTRYLPFNDGGPKFMEGPYTRDLLALEHGQGSEGMTIVLNLENDQTYGLIKAGSLKAMTDVMEKIGSISGSRDSATLRDEMEKLVEVVVSELIQGSEELEQDGYDLEDDVSTELGASLYRILERNNVNEDIEFMDEPLAHWENKFREEEEAGGRVYPFEAICDHVLRMKDMYEDEVPTKRIGRNEILSPAVEFEAALTKITSTLVKAEEAKVLEAHDMIRKMNNKPISYVHGKLDDYNDVNDAIEIIKEDYNTELTPFELEAIVLDFDSHSNLSKKHGVSTEVIYYSKSVFR